MKTTVLAGVALALALVLAIAAYVSYRASERASAEERLRAERTAAELARERLATPPTAESVLEPAPTPNEPPRVEVPAAEPASQELVVTGRVTSGGGCGFDELEVLIAPDELLANTVDTWVDVPSKEGKKSPFLARVRAEGDGSFRATLPSDTARVFVHARGRYLYSPAPRAIDPRERAPVVVPAVCGACLEGRIEPPVGAPPVQAPLAVELESTIESLAGGGGEDRVDRRLTAADGRFVFRALRPAKLELAVTSEVHPTIVRPIEDLVPGRTQVLDLRLLRGATLRGRVVGPDGAGIAGAKVRALRPGRWFGFGDEAARERQSDSDGTFELPAVITGSVRLTAEKDGFVASEPLRLDLADAAVVENLVVVLGLGNSIEGLVTWPGGKPATGVAVNVEFDKSQMAGMTAFNAVRGAEGSARTDASGHFVVRGLGAGPFTVRAEARPEHLGADAESARKEPLSRARKDDVKPNTKDLALELRPPVSVRGRVVDALGRPVARHRVEAQAQGKGLLRQFGQEEVATDVQDERGDFVLELPREGEWQLTASAEGYADSDPFELVLPRPGDAAPIVITIVRSARIEGLVQDPAGTIVSGAEVEVSTGEPRWARAVGGRAPPSAKTDEQGRFTLEGVKGGSVKLVASAKNFARSAEFGIDVAPGEERAGVVLVLRAGGRLTGEVFVGGKPGASMLVQATLTQNYDQRAGFTDATGRFEIAHLEPGSYQVVALKTDAAIAGADGAEPDLGALLENMKMASAEIVDGQDTHVVLGAPPADPVHVHGRVMHAGEPYSGAMVSFMGGSKDVLAGMKIATVAADGTYATDLDAPGRYTVLVQKIGGSPGEQQSVEFRREIPAGKDHVLDIQMPNGRISGRVFGPDGAPAAHVTIGIANEGGLEAGSLFGGQLVMSSTDAEGRYDLRALKAGTYTISAGGSALGGMLGAERAFGRMAKKHLKVGDGSWLKDVDFRLEKPGEVEVTVVGPDGRPVSEAGVFARDGEGHLVDAMTMVQSGADGTARYSGLSPGKYTFSARFGDLSSGDSPAVDVAAGSKEKVRIALVKGTILKVQVLDAQGRPVQAELLVLDAAGRDVANMIDILALQKRLSGGAMDENGMRVGPLAPGKYRVRAVRGDGKVVEKPLTLAGQAERSVKLEFED